MNPRYSPSKNETYSGTLKIGSKFYIFEIVIQWLGYYTCKYFLSNGKNIILVSENEKTFNAKINKWKKKLGDGDTINITFDGQRG